MLSVWVSCASSQLAQRAQAVRYDAEFAIVYAAALAVVKQHYRDVQEVPTQGVVKTSWHQVQFNQTTEDPRAAMLAATAQGYQTPSTANGYGVASTPRSAYRRYFVRFDVAVTGNKPWRVQVVGSASEWEPGMAQPVPLRGANVPPWLAGRTDALRVAIYERLRQHAVPDELGGKPVVPVPGGAADASYAHLPPGAAGLLRRLRALAEARDFTALTPELAKDVAWAADTPGDASTALALWRADAQFFSELAHALAGSCAPDGAAVQCSAATLRLRISAQGGAWQVLYIGPP